MVNPEGSGKFIVMARGLSDLDLQPSYKATACLTSTATSTIPKSANYKSNLQLQQAQFPHPLVSFARHCFCLL
jgi:hypothetical protein